MNIRVILSVVLIASLAFAGCTTAQFIQVLNEVPPAISTILQIIALAENKPANTALPAKIAGDVATLEKLYYDFQAAKIDMRPGIESDIGGAFLALNQDLSMVLKMAQVSNPNTQAKITALISLVETAVQIAEAAIPASAKSATLAPVHLNASAVVDSFNKILVAKTGVPNVDAATPHMRLHLHSNFVRAMSMGRAK